MPLFLDAITTNETYFFRDMQHYAWLGETFLPEIARQAASGNGPASLRIWSAACSTGEEPYSIALKVLAQAAPLRRLEDQRCVGTDLSGAVLAAARAGSYDERAVHLVEPPSERKRFFDEDAAGTALDHQARGPGAGHLEAAQPAHARSRKSRSTASSSRMC